MAFKLIKLITDFFKWLFKDELTICPNCGGSNIQNEPFGGGAECNDCGHGF